MGNHNKPEKNFTDRVIEELIKSEERYRNIITAITDYIYTVRVEKGKPVETKYGPGCLAVTGYTQEEFASNPLLWIEMVANGDKDRVRKWSASILDGEEVKPLEHRIIRKEGNMRWIENTAVIHRNDKGEMTSYDGVVKDITDRKRMEYEKSRAETLDRLKTEKDNFMNTISHELRTPLAAIKESIAIVSEGLTGKMDAEKKKCLEIAERNVDRLGRLINEVLDFQKLRAGRMTFKIEENDLNGVVRECHRTMSILAKSKDLKFILELDDKLPKVRFDKDKIIQVLANIVNNAIKFTKNGKITISTGHNENVIEIAVRDTGIGIRAEDMHRLFQTFEQIEGDAAMRAGGTGLGLAISKDIIEKHKGKIWAESQFGKGSVFYIVLPIIERRGGVWQKEY